MITSRLQKAETVVRIIEALLVAPGTSFNVPYTNHVRLTLLPDEETMTEVFVRMERLLGTWARRGR